MFLRLRPVWDSESEMSVRNWRDWGSTAAVRACWPPAHSRCSSICTPSPEHPAASNSNRMRGQGRGPECRRGAHTGGDCGFPLDVVGHGVDLVGLDGGGCPGGGWEKSLCFSRRDALGIRSYRCYSLMPLDLWGRGRNRGWRRLDSALGALTDGKIVAI